MKIYKLREATPPTQEEIEVYYEDLFCLLRIGFPIARMLVRIDWLIKYRVSLDNIDNSDLYFNDKQTLLHVAVQKNLKEVVKALIEGGALVDKKDGFERIPLYYAQDAQIKALLTKKDLLQENNNASAVEVSELDESSSEVNQNNSDSNLPPSTPKPTIM